MSINNTRPARVPYIDDDLGDGEEPEDDGDDVEPLLLKLRVQFAGVVINEKKVNNNKKKKNERVRCKA